MTGDAPTAALPFYAARDKRTMQYGATDVGLSKPVVLRVDTDVARTRAGRVASLALVEMLFRVHRQVRIEIADDGAGGGARLTTELVAAAAQIDPFQDPLRDAVDQELVIQLTATPFTSDADVVVTWSGGRGEVHVRGQHPAESPGSNTYVSEGGDTLGAATAACLAAAAAFGLVHGTSPRPAAVNLLTRTSGIDAGIGTATGPIEVGDVDVIGGGAVGHALTYWANVFGIVGTWTVIDGDTAEIHNTNRCMGMTISDAGWPGGFPNGLPAKKAVSAARNCGAQVEEDWFHDLPPGRNRPDLKLVLANEFGIREVVAQSGEPLLLHATTSPNWTAELHRHIPGRDDCPACRIPSRLQPTFTCSKGSVDPTDQESGDAALPFLSAMSGLMLCAAMLDLTDDGRVLEGRDNHWVVHLELPPGSPVQANPHPGYKCMHHLLPAARRALQSVDPKRWDDIDD